MFFTLKHFMIPVDCLPVVWVCVCAFVCLFVLCVCVCVCRIIRTKSEYFSQVHFKCIAAALNREELFFLL